MEEIDGRDMSEERAVGDEAGELDADEVEGPEIDLDSAVEDKCEDECDARGELDEMADGIDEAAIELDFTTDEIEGAEEADELGVAETLDSTDELEGEVCVGMGVTVCVGVWVGVRVG